MPNTGKTDGNVPATAWRVVFAGTAINLCLGCLYAWSVWARYLTDDEMMTTQGWTPLTPEQASNPALLCMLVFTLFMIPGGKLHDRFGPTVTASIGGIAIGLGLIVAGAMKSYVGVLLGFGIGGGIGMGFGYAAPTPTALKWFGTRKRGLIAGLVVSGFGLAAFYVVPLAKWLITEYSVSASFYLLGLAYAIVILTAAQFLAWPEDSRESQVPVAAQVTSRNQTFAAPVDWAPGEMLRTWQFYALVVMFYIGTQAGLLLIGFAAKMITGLMSVGYMLISWGAVFNSAGRIGTGAISDRLGRTNGLVLNYIAAAMVMFLLPYILFLENVLLLFLATAIGFWCYGGGLALLPSLTADFFGTKNMGINYGLVFVGWGLGAVVTPMFAEHIYLKYQSYDYAFYIAGLLLLFGILLALVTGHPQRNKD